MPVEVDMDWRIAFGAAVAVSCLAGGAGCESVDPADAERDPADVPGVVAETSPGVAAEAVSVAAREAAPDGAPSAAPEAASDAAPDADPEQYRISVEIPVDDVTIARGENLDVAALLDERTAFDAADFHLREVVLIVRSRRGGSAELLIDDWASGAVDIPLGDAEAWYEIRIPAADVADAGTQWVVDFTGALDLNLLVAVLEPRSALLAAATASAVEDEAATDVPGEAVEDPPVEDADERQRRNAVRLLRQALEELDGVRDAAGGRP